jgi:hypothetical protein
MELNNLVANPLFYKQPRSVNKVNKTADNRLVSPVSKRTVFQHQQKDPSSKAKKKKQRRSKRNKNKKQLSI